MSVNVVCRMCTRRIHVGRRVLKEALKIAIIGQSQFGADVLRLLQRNEQYKVVGVFTVPDNNGRPDPIADVAAAENVRVFKFARWRNRGSSAVSQEVMQQYLSVEADLNVLPYCTQYIPMEVIQQPRLQSICYHPSILPRHRGASAIHWTLIHGDEEAGLTVFWADEGLDTGPIILQKTCRVDDNDTVDSLYNRFLYPEGIKAMGEAVGLVAAGSAQRIVQPTEGASYEPILKKDHCQLDWKLSAQQLHNFIRGTDRLPGAWAVIDGQKLTLYGSRLWKGPLPKPKSELIVDGCDRKALIHDGGLLLFDSTGQAVNVVHLQDESGRTVKASDYGQPLQAKQQTVVVNYTDEDLQIKLKIKDIWSRILGLSVVDDTTDFFRSGARSMDVVRLVEEVRTHCGGIVVRNDDVYLSPNFEAFAQLVILARRGEGSTDFTYNPIEKLVRDTTKVQLAHQLFINNKYVDSSDGSTFDTICPIDESVICSVANGTVDDVNKAVAAAHMAFHDGEWSRMNARERGKLLYRLADLMESCKEELALIETIDSGAVYTLALKTHIGMSIDAFRYFAGWTDKIQGRTVPINHARPNKNLTFTKREPIGVCGIITPWNYPLMMLAWKLSACLAAGNTVVLKPAQVTPLTSLKFGELVVKAGFPPGVVNIVTGSGSVVGTALARHPDVRKVGFTGSTSVGKTIMQHCSHDKIKRVSLELGGKSPMIIFSDSDLDRAVRSACNGVFFNKGENCIAAGRIFVENKIHDQFMDGVLREVGKMNIGDPLDTRTDHGPQNHRAHLESLLRYCDVGQKEGASLQYGGRRVDRPGFFMFPTVFTNVSDEMFVAKEESFGPIMLVSTFPDGDDDEVIRRANASDYGLAAGVFTKDVTRALRASDRLEAGTVFINTYNKTDVAAPFGGTKQSGFGKDLGEEALNEYLQTKTVTVEY